MANNALYFQHHICAGEEECVLSLRMKHGCAGYGLYMLLLELLAKSEDGRMELNYKLLAFALREPDTQFIQEVIEDYGLFVIDTETNSFYSQELQVEHQAAPSFPPLPAPTLTPTPFEGKRKRGGQKGNCNAKKKRPIQVQEKEPASAPPTASIVVEEPPTASHTLFEEPIPAPQEIQVENVEVIEEPPPIEADGKPKIGLAGILPLWKEICPHLKQPIKLSPDRVKNLYARAREHNAKTAEDFQDVCREVFYRVANSDFLSGRNNQNWRATFDWLVGSPRNWLKVMEGNYDNSPPQQTPNATNENPFILAPKDWEIRQAQREQIIMQGLNKHLQEQKKKPEFINAMQYVQPHRSSPDLLPCAQ